MLSVLLTSLCFLIWIWSIIRIMSSDLTSGPFTTDLPAACRVTFPISSTLQEVTGAYQTVNLMVSYIFVHSPVYDVTLSLYHLASTFPFN